MKKMMLVAFVAFLMSGLTQNLLAQKTVVDIALGSSEHTTLVAAVKAADLVGALQGDGPFTVFAPVNAAFEKLPAGTVTTLLEPANKPLLTRVLTYHVIAGSFDAATVIKAVSDGDGKAVIKTLSGASLTITTKDGNVILTDENGGMAKVILADLKAGNGVVHVIDTVVLPK